MKTPESEDEGTTEADFAMILLRHILRVSPPAWSSSMIVSLTSKCSTSLGEGGAFIAAKVGVGDDEGDDNADRRVVGTGGLIEKRKQLKDP